jgi:hypothetical protein
MGTVRRTVTSAVLSVGLLFAFAPFATAAVAPPPPPPSLTLSPATGPAGTKFTITWANFTVCRVIGLAYAWSGGAPPSGSPGTRGTTSSAVPAGTKAGSYLITATCSNTDITQTARATFRVTAITTTTTPPTPPTTTTVPPPPPTTVRIPPTTRRPVTTTPRPTTTTPPPPTTTAPPTTTDTATPTTTGGGLVLDHGTIQAGDPLSASGTGCRPGHTVTLMSDGDHVGDTVADDAGTFTTPVVFTTIDPGTHVITADCGVMLTGEVTQVVTSSVGGDNSGALIILVFFVLAGIVLVRFV